MYQGKRLLLTKIAESRGAEEAHNSMAGKHTSSIMKTLIEILELLVVLCIVTVFIIFLLGPLEEKIGYLAGWEML